MEIYHLHYNKKMILILIGLFILNGVLFLRQSGGEWDVTAQEEYLQSYPEYVENVMEEAGRVSRFSVFASDQGEFSSQNASNIVKAYEGLRDVELRMGNDQPVVQLVNDPYIIYISLAMVLLIVFTVVREHKSGISQIIYLSARGRFALGLRRGVYIALATVLIVAGNMLSVLLLSLGKYGGNVDFGRSIQSIEMFADMTSQISIAGFLLRYYVIMAFAIMIVGIFVWMMMSLIPNTILSVLGIGIIFLMEYNWTRTITIQSNWRFFKYVNILEYMNISAYMFKYYDIKFLGNAVNLFRFVICNMGISFVILAVLGMVVFMKRPVGARGDRDWKIFRCFHRLQEHDALTLVELQKTLFSNKGIWVILVIILVASGIMSRRNIVYTDVEKYVKEFYEEYEGTVNDEVKQHIAAEHEYVDGVYQEYEEIQQLYQEGKVEIYEVYCSETEVGKAKVVEEGLQRIEAEIERAEELKNNRGIQMYLLDNGGYERLFGDAGQDTQREIMVLSLLCMVLLFSGSFQYEKHSQMVSLLRTTARGRQPFIRAKRRSFIFILICIVGILYGVQLYYTARQYGLSQVFAPVQSIQILNSFPLKWNILSYAIVLVIVRVLFYLLIADLLLQLSVLMDQKIVIIAFVGLMILPIILGQSGNALFDKISYFNLLNINEMVLGQASIILELIKAGVLLGILILARIMAIRKWCE